MIGFLIKPRDEIRLVMKRIFLIIILNLCMFGAGMAQWHQANGPYGGHVISTVIDQIPNYIYSVPEHDSFNKSTNDGSIWTEENNGLL